MVISVIAPVYNGESTIKETIESVLKQTFSDFELIIIDDGSQDSTLDVVSNIQDSRIKVFSYPNAGLATSRNRGIAQAKGEYISFIDADDLWTSDKLEAQLKALQSNPQAAVAYSWTDQIDEKSHFLRSGLHNNLNGNVYSKLLLRNFLENGSNPLIHRDALAEIGGFDESLQCAEDWDLYLRLAAKYNFVCVPSPQILYRISANSMSRNTNKMEKALLYMIQKNFSQAPLSLQSLKKASISNIYIYLACKTIEGQPSFDKSLTSFKCLWHLLQNNPSIIKKRYSLISIMLFKILVGLLLPSRQAQQVLKIIKKSS